MGSPSLSTQAVADVVVKPDVYERVSAILSTYKDLQLQIELLEEMADAEKAKIFALMKEEGLKKLVVAGTPCTVCNGGSSGRFNKAKFVELGGSLKQYEEAIVRKPKEDYLRIGEDKSEKGDE